MSPLKKRIVNILPKDRTVQQKFLSAVCADIQAVATGPRGTGSLTSSLASTAISMLSTEED